MSRRNSVIRRRISPCDGHWYIVLSYRHTSGYWTRGQMSDGCSVMRFLCARDFAPLQVRHQSEVYGARGYGVRCSVFSSGWTCRVQAQPPRLAVGECWCRRASGAGLLYRGACSREGRLIDKLLSGN